MKGLILTLAMVASASASAIPFEEFDINTMANDPASDYVLQTMTKGKQIMELKSDSERLRQMCALAKANVGRSQIAGVWLGDFAKLSRDAAAVQQFVNIVPNIIMTKAVDAAGGGGTLSGSFVVNPKATSRGNNVYAVKVTVTEAKGKSYNGTVVVVNGRGGWKVIDGEYLGFSAVNYQGREYQKFLRAEYNKDTAKSLPVTALVKHITSESGYVNCN